MSSNLITPKESGSEPPHLTFRLATASDAVPLTNLINASFRHDPTTDIFLSPTHDEIDVTSLPEVEATISDPAKSVILAVSSSSSSSDDDDDGSPERIIGHCSVHLLSNNNNTITTANNNNNDDDNDNKSTIKTAWLSFLAVDNSIRSRGIGSRLLSYGENHAKTNLGADRMEFAVVWTRERLIGWYKSRGYVDTGRTREFLYDRHPGWEGVLREDLGFVILGKDL